MEVLASSSKRTDKDSFSTLRGYLHTNTILRLSIKWYWIPTVCNAYTTISLTVLNILTNTFSLYSRPFSINKTSHYVISKYIITFFTLKLDHISIMIWFIHHIVTGDHMFWYIRFVTYYNWKLKISSKELCMLLINWKMESIFLILHYKNSTKCPEIATSADIWEKTF